MGGILSLGFVVVLEREIEGVEPRDVDGRTLASQRHVIDSIAHEEDLRGLGEFVAFSQAEAEALAEDMKFDAPTVGDQTGRWFRAEDGLKVVRTVHDHIAADPDEVDDAPEILDALRSMEKILSAASERGVRFRLSLDY
jgi:hypothetical protein